MMSDPRAGLNRRLFLGAVLAAGFLVTVQAAAQEYPSRPIRMIVPNPPGGSNDVAARLLAEEMGATLNQKIIIENRPGASGNTGIEVVARSAPDGYTIGVAGSGATVVNPIMGPVPSFNVLDDLAYVGHISRVEWALITRKDFPANSVQEMIAVAKANPGKYSYAEGGGPAHLAFERFKLVSGTDFLHVPYKGDAEAISDVMGGHVDVAFSTLAGSVSLIQGGAVKALAVPSPTRSIAIPTLPTFAEAGFPGFEVSVSAFMVAPKGTPEPIIQKLNAALNAALRKTSVVEKYTALGLASVPLTPAETKSSLIKDIEQAAKIIKDANIPIQKK